MAASPFSWPEGKQVALSLSFDDARATHPTVALPLLEESGTKVTFYVVPSAVQKNLEGWHAIVAAGHEIGNHSIHHPCSGNFTFARPHALENYTLEQMEAELLQCNQEVHDLLGVVPRTFGYPCGLTFVGRGEQTQSYVPVVAKHFLAGRLFMSEYHNTPGSLDRAQLMGRNFDGVSFDTFKEWVETARKEQGWLALAGHEVGDGTKRQTVDAAVLRQVCAFAKDPATGIWIDTIENVAHHVRQQEQAA